MPFRFPLAAVLRVRESIEKREERALQQLQAEVSRLTLRIDELEREQRKIVSLRGETMTRPIAAFHLHALEQSLQIIDESRKTVLKELQNVTARMNNQIQIYMASQRDRELLTEMMIKQRDAYSSELNRREQSKLDDLFSSRRNR
jgi:flagellar export protein FliJ